MQARLYQLAKTAMQQGQGKTRRWLLEFEQETPRHIEPLMGWTSSSDTKQQLSLWFDSLEEAEAYCRRSGIMYSVEQPQERAVRPKSYADNFAYRRPFPWTH